MKNSTLIGNRCRASFLSLIIPLLSTATVHAQETVDHYIDMPLADLLSMEVTSVAKKKQRLNEVAAAIFVITQEDIQRSGVTSIPEALRMAPGIQVARIDANKWAIASRGFASQFSNKLLVMIDGRTVYTPSFSGVYWDVQDTLLEDIDRIEVIRGPGATIWGANAVNGVINIITKSATQTQGGLMIAGAGNEEKTFGSARYGFETENGISARIYMKYNDRDSSYSPELRDDAGDDWQSLRGGFRVDAQPTEADLWTVQGDIYKADENQLLNLWKDPSDPDNGIYAPFFLAPLTPDSIDSSGRNLLTKWDHAISDQSSIALQLYYDHTERMEALVNQAHNTLDIDFQHEFRAFKNHDVIWGLGYRNIRDDFDNTFMVSILPDHESRNLYSLFVQDEITLLPDSLHLTLGSKFEHNDYTGLEVQPNARLMWLPDANSSLWGSISRAARTPSRVEYGSQTTAVIVPIPPTFTPVVINALGTDDYQSEYLTAYEIGYRIQPRENFSLDLALFYNDYDDLQIIEKAVPVNPLSDAVFTNNLTANSYGLELAMDWRPLEWWRLQSNYGFLDIHTTSKGDGIAKDDADLNENSSPTHQLSLRSMMDLDNNLSLDLWIYHVDELKKTSISIDRPVSDYTSLNVRLAWHPADKLELSVVGQNLLEDHHLEFVGENLIPVAEVERSVHAQIRWDF